MTTDRRRAGRPGRGRGRKPKLAAAGVGVWVITYGTARVVTVAPTDDDAARWFRGWVAEERTGGRVGPDPVHFHVHPATRLDVDALIEAGKAPSWTTAVFDVVDTST